MVPLEYNLKDWLVVVDVVVRSDSWMRMGMGGDTEWVWRK